MCIRDRKSSATWKISLSSVRSGEFSEGMIENDSRGGLSYGSYLKLLLLTEDTETKLLRMMDLIQINMKGSERKDFVLSNLFCGFIVRAQLEKRSICAGIGTAQTSVRMVHTCLLYTSERETAPLAQRVSVSSFRGR